MTGPEHERLQSAIPAAGRGELSPSETRELETHVSACDSCRELLQIARRIARLTPHASVEELRGFALGPVSARSKTIESHARECASCAIEIESWRRRPLFRSGRFAVVAGTLAASLLVLVWFGSIGHDGGPRHSPASPDAQVVVFSESLRSSSGERILELDPQLDFELRVEWETVIPYGEVGPLTLELSRPGAPPLWHREFGAEEVTEILRAATGFRARVPAGKLAAGEHEFKMFRGAPNEEPPLIQERFQVR